MLQHKYHFEDNWKQIDQREETNFANLSINMYNSFSNVILLFVLVKRKDNGLGKCFDGHNARDMELGWFIEVLFFQQGGPRLLYNGCITNACNIWFS